MLLRTHLVGHVGEVPAQGVLPPLLLAQVVAEVAREISRLLVVVPGGGLLLESKALLPVTANGRLGASPKVIAYARHGQRYQLGNYAQDGALQGREADLLLLHLHFHGARWM